jgi:hypothetical protein
MTAWKWLGLRVKGWGDVTEVAWFWWQGKPAGNVSGTWLMAASPSALEAATTSAVQLSLAGNALLLETVLAAANVAANAKSPTPPDLVTVPPFSPSGMGCHGGPPVMAGANSASAANGCSKSSITPSEWNRPCAGANGRQQNGATDGAGGEHTSARRAAETNGNAGHGARGASNGAGSEGGDGENSPDRQTAWRPVGLTGGRWFTFGSPDDAAADQRADDSLSVCFGGAPLETDTLLLGAPRLCLAMHPPAGAADRPGGRCPPPPKQPSAHGLLQLATIVFAVRLAAARVAADGLAAPGAKGKEVPVLLKCRCACGGPSFEVLL